MSPSLKYPWGIGCVLHLCSCKERKSTPLKELRGLGRRKMWHGSSDSAALEHSPAPTPPVPLEDTHALHMGRRCRRSLYSGRWHRASIVDGSCQGWWPEDWIQSHSLSNIFKKHFSWVWAVYLLKDKMSFSFPVSSGEDGNHCKLSKHCIWDCWPFKGPVTPILVKAHLLFPLGQLLRNVPE